MTLHAFVSTFFISYFYVLLFFAVQMLMLVCFLRMMAVGFLGVQLRQPGGDQMGFALRFRGFDGTTCWEVRDACEGPEKSARQQIHYPALG